MTSLLLTRLDFCDGLLFGLPANQIRRLQSVQNAAARLIFNLRRSEHISDALINLHWLRIPGRIRFKVAVFVYRALHLTILLRCQLSRGVRIYARRRLTDCSFLVVDFLPSVIVPFRLLVLQSGTTCQWT